MGGVDAVVKHLSEYKKMGSLMKSSLLSAPKPGKGKCKPCVKGVKKVAAGGSKGKGKKRPN